MKICRKCGEEKEFGEFQKKKSTCDGYGNCKKHKKTHEEFLKYLEAEDAR